MPARNLLIKLLCCKYPTALQAAKKMMCPTSCDRCLPKFSSDVLAQLVSASDTSQKILSSNSTLPLSKYLNMSAQRLQRYIADIQKGFVIIVVAGKDMIFYSIRH